MRNKKPKATSAQKSGLARAGFSRRSLIRYHVAAALAAAWGSAAAGTPHLPNLPTPCVTGPCGTNAGPLNFVQSGQATAVAQGANLTVNQTSGQVILNWQDFNIAPGYSVTFKQPTATAAALNEIWSASPSTIAGELKANGQIYLINQNGIVFDKGAQVDVGGLVASSLEVSEATFSNGILSQNAVASFPTTQPAVFQAGTAAPGAVTVNAGATLQTADGGRIMLLAPVVSNAGTIATPDGQAILGAGTAVYLAASNDPALRGLLIAVNGQGIAANSTVTNTGSVSANRGNVTLAGLVVNQSGTVSATTSVNANGSIFLVAGDTSSATDQNFYDDATGVLGYGAVFPNNGGTLTLGPGSVTQVLPDTSGASTITNQVTFLPSQVMLAGHTVVLQGGADIHAPGGTVGILAAADPFGAESGSVPPLTSDGSRIYLAPGSTIDVAGLESVPVQATRNILEVTLESIDLQNDPLLRDGFLHGATVYVNANVGSNLFDITPYIDNIGHGIDEELTTGGSITLNSYGDVITRAGSKLNVSGGSIAYQGGYGPATTKLVGSNGVVYDISNAPNNIPYTGFADSYSYTDPTWGITTSSSAEAYYPGYTQGANAGGIQILAPEMYLRGSIEAQTVAGILQRLPGTLPLGGTLSIGNTTQVPGRGEPVDLRSPNVTFAAAASDTLGSGFDPLTSELPATDAATLVLATSELAPAGFDTLNVSSNGTITFPASVSLSLQGGGGVHLLAESIAMDGSITAPGASVSMFADAFIRSPFTAPNFDVTLGDNASINVSGEWVNDSPRVTTVPGTAPVFINGGSVSLKGADDVVTGAGSLIDVSGGGWLNVSNRLTPGAAGSITLEADAGTAVPPATGVLQLNGTLEAASLSPSGGGSLTLQSGYITVGSHTPGALGELLLSPAFFSESGFGNYTLDGVNGITLGAKSQPVTITLLEKNLVLDPSYAAEPTGADLRGFSTLETLPAWERSATSAAFNAGGYLAANNQETGGILLNQGTVIDADPGATISMVATQANLTVLGSIIAPAGNVLLQLGPTSPGAFPYLPNQELLLGPQAVISTPAAAVLNTNNPLGLVQGTVLPGGTISLQANLGYVVTDPGSVLNVSGSQATLDILTASGYRPTAVAGNGGTIDIDAREGLVLQGTLDGRPAAVSGAGGGTLSIGLDLFNFNTTAGNNQNDGFNQPTTPRVVTLSNTPAAELSSDLVSGTALLSTDSLTSGGFQSITLKATDIIAFDGTVSLSAPGSLTLDAPVLLGSPGASVQLSAPHVMLGDYFTVPGASQEVLGTATGGNATLQVSATLIDVRGSSDWNGFASATLNSSGDTRLAPAESQSTPILQAGELAFAGDLTLRAAQIYPTTGTQFTIEDAAGSVTVLGQGAAVPQVPLSAAGDLIINAANISQLGVLRAPLGQISLNGSNSVVLGPGSLTSVSADGAIIPYGSTLNGLEWTYDNGTGPAQISTLPAKTISIAGPSIRIADGAKVDLSGGGDTYAYEFIAGPGGSKDVLTSSAGGYQYAIVPTLGSQFAPIDVQYGSAGLSSAPDVYLSGVPGIPAGLYALLPARYALLPGAYAVNIVTPNSDVLPGSSTRQPDGTFLVAGVLGVAGTNILASRTSTLLIVPDSVVRTQAQYTDSYGDSFFTGLSTGTGSVTSTPIPADGGTLQLVSSGTMSLGGTFSFSPASFTALAASGKTVTELGIGGDVEIVAPEITVVDAVGGSGNPGLQITAASLNNLHAETVILGATSSLTSTGDALSVDAQSVNMANTAADALTAPNIILAATQDISFAPGAAVSATGGSGPSPGTFLVSGDGALFVASAGPQATVLRTGVGAQPQGQINLGTGAVVAASGSVLLDATENTSIAPGAALSTPALSVASSEISVGNAPAGTPGLVLTPALLSQLGGITNLTLVSASTIDLFGSVALGVPGAGHPALQTLTLDAGGIGGYGAGNKLLEANVIDLQDSGGTSTFGTTPNGTGTLTLLAGPTAQGTVPAVNLGAGNLAVQGFGDVTLQSTGVIQTTGTGALTLANAGDLALVSPRLISAAGATYAISNAGGAVTLQAVAASSGASSLAAGFGGALTINAATVTQNGDIDLPGGIITLHASGTLALGSGSITSAAGVTESFGNTYATAPGGTIELISDQANVSIAGGALVDVSGAAGPGGVAAGSAGSLSIAAPEGQLLLSGTLKGGAPAGQLAGDFALDVGSLASFSSLNSALAAGGFTGVVSDRVRTGDVTVAASDVVTASQFTLAADAGSIDIAGEINTGGGNALSADGGAIAIWAGGNLDVLSGARLIANAGIPSNGALGRGGGITLGTVSGALDLQSGSTLSTLGSQSDADGYVTLAAPAINNHTDVAITEIGSSLQTRQPLIVEGVTVYQMSGPATLSNSPDVLVSPSTYSNLAIGSSTEGTSGILFSDAATLEGNASAIVARLEGTNAGLAAHTLEIRPGVEVEGAGDVTLSSTWDLENWSAALGAPVNVTLRAAGNLTLAGSLSDGFTNTNSTTTPASWTFGTQVGDSAALRLGAGSDLTAANPLASALADSPEISGGGGNFILTPGNLVRTGTGTIQISAGNDVQIGFDPSNGTYSDANASTAVVYTAGIPAQLTAQQAALFPVPVAGQGRRSTPFVASYPTDGGDISVTAGADIVAAPSQQLITNWLWRRGAVNTDGSIAPNLNPTWWVVFSDFQQGVGALGGGDVNVTAGGNIVNLSAVIPTTGRLVGAADTQPSLSNLVIDGGGSLNVRAGGNIASGVFETDLGNALLSAGGGFTSGRVQGDTNPNGSDPSAPIYPILVLGDGDMTTVGRTGVTLDAAVNATTLPEVTGNVQFARSYFNTFAPTSSLDVVSIAGDVLLNNDTQQQGASSVLGGIAPRGTYDNGYDYENLAVYPPVVTISTLSGSIFTGATTTLYPSPVGNLELLAADNVTIGGLLQMSEVNPSLAANLLHPLPNLETALGGGGDLSTVPLPLIPLHQSDTQPVEIVAATGNIGTNQGEGTIVLPKAADLIAGGDIQDLTYSGKNLNPGDVTLFEAGGAISFETAQAGQGEALLSSSEGIQVAGPGVVEALAGAAIDLSDSNGIVTSGALNDPRLPQTGASLVVGAGFGTNTSGGLRTPATTNFIDTYLAPAAGGAPSSYAQLLESYVTGLDPTANSGLSYTQSLAVFRALPMQQQLPLLAQVLYDELSATGIAHTTQGTSYQRGFTAIDTLFPTTIQGQSVTYSGDVDMFFSQLKTEQGGDVDLLVPGGSVVVGLPNPPADLAAIKSIGIPPVPAAANLGVLVLGTGAIQGFTSDNFTVNQSRMLTLEGGNIILWASDGNIDAGRGAKSASGAPPPVIETDAEGNVFVDPLNDVSGSGIGQLVVTPGIKPGFVNLIAPSGIVNAGDAGIRVAGNLNIAAVAVIGANNITVGGTATGVPVSEAGAFAGALSGASSLGDVGKNAVDQLTSSLAAASNFQQLTDSLTPTFIIVKMFCLGTDCQAH